MAAGTSAGVAAGSPASASVGGGVPGLSQEAIDKIVNAASNEEEWLRWLQRRLQMGPLEQKYWDLGLATPRRLDPNHLNCLKVQPFGLFPMGTAELGAMTDASKRRFDPDEEAMMEDGFEMVSSNVYDL